MALKDPRPPQDEEAELFAEHWDDPARDGKLCLEI